jgi:hypothetical protein
VLKSLGPHGTTNAPGIILFIVNHFGGTERYARLPKQRWTPGVVIVHHADAQKDTNMREFTFQATLIASIRVKAATRAEAEQKLGATLAATDANLGMLDGAPIIVPIDLEGGLVLIEITESVDEERRR